MDKLLNFMASAAETLHDIILRCTSLRRWYSDTRRLTTFSSLCNPLIANFIRIVRATDVNVIYSDYILAYFDKYARTLACIICNRECYIVINKGKSQSRERNGVDDITKLGDVKD